MVAAAHPVCPIELYSPWPPTQSASVHLGVDCSFRFNPFKGTASMWGRVFSESHREHVDHRHTCTSLQGHLVPMHNDLPLCHIRNTGSWILCCVTSGVESTCMEMCPASHQRYPCTCLSQPAMPRTRLPFCVCHLLHSSKGHQRSALLP